MSKFHNKGGYIGFSDTTFCSSDEPNVNTAPSYVTGLGCNLSTGTDFTYPSGIRKDDFILIAQCNDTGDVSSAPTDGATTSYTVLEQVTGDLPDGLICYKFADGSESGTTISINRDGGQGSAVLQVFRNVNTASPFDVGYTSYGTGPFDEGDPDAPAITTASAYTLIVAIGLLDDDPVEVTAPSGYSNLTYQYDSNSSGASCTTMMASKVLNYAGTENPGAFGITSGGDAYQSRTYALRKSSILSSTSHGMWNLGASSKC